jgi:hypothetical protein
MSGEVATSDAPDSIATTSPEPNQRKHVYWAAAILLGIVLALMGDLLFIPGDRVVSHIKGDTAQNHIFMRGLGFEEIRNGNLPLWNPYLFSGTPFLGSMQAALLYPLNIPYLFLPITQAINIDVALHLFLIGFFTFLWMRNWRVHWIGALYAGIVVMVCGAIFLRILAGQINVIASLAWFPLLLMSIDGIITRASWKRFPSPWALLGVLATTMLLYAGYPQALFICAVSAALYSAIRLPSARSTWPALLELGIVGLLPIFLGAMQLWTGIATGFESIRGSEMTYEFASSFSMPPEKLVTLVAPAFFGDVLRVGAWGRWGFWDDSMYVGVITLLFAGYGLRSEHRTLKWLALLICVGTLLIAMGRYTPIHPWLFENVPGFDKFRAPSKFLFTTSFFLAVLAGLGVDRLMQIERPSRLFVWGSFVCSGIVFVMGFAFILLDVTSEGKPWWELLAKMKATPDTYIWVDITQELVEQTAILARNNFLEASAFLFLTGMALYGASRRPFLKALAVGVGVAELLVFAYSYRDTFEVDDLRVSALDEALASDLGSERILCVPRWYRDDSNFAVGQRTLSVWGYDPIVLDRYARLMATMSAGFEHREKIEEHVYNWGTEPISVGLNLGYLKFTEDGPTHSDKVFQMLRCRYLVKLPMASEYMNYLNFIRGFGLVWDEDVSYIPDVDSAIHRVENLMPRFSIMSNYKVIQEHDTILETLDSPEFDPFKTVILEKEPDPVPGPGTGSSSIEVLDESTDHVTLRVEASQAGILLITDAYSDGWKAMALPGSVQQKYEVMPADLALRAIPLEAGSHLFRLEYLPDAFIYGRIATFAGMGVFLLLAVVSYRRRDASSHHSEAHSAQV